MNITLPSSIATPRDIEDIVQDLEHYAKWFSQASIKLKGGIDYANPPEISAYAVKLLEDVANGGDMTTEIIDSVINTLLDLKDDSPRITMTLAAKPTASVKTLLVEWCRANISPAILVELKHDRSLLGGMVVQFGSSLHDWSFKRQISLHANEIPKAFRNV